MKSRLFACFCVLSAIFFPTAPLLSATSLSDVAVEQLEKGMALPQGRDPFSPADIEGGGVDVNSLSLEGFIIGGNLELALLAGSIVRVGDSVGDYTVVKITPGDILLKSDGEENHVKMSGYVPPFRKNGGGLYTVEFQQADIKNALRLLAKAGGYNLIIPEDMGGWVNLSFENISLQDAIRSILKVNNFSFALENSIMRVGKTDDFKGGTDLTAITIHLKYATAKSLANNIKSLLSDKGSVTSDDRSNSLSVKDYDANIEGVKKYVDSVDRRDQQVLIEAHIVDAAQDFSRSLGVQWGVSGTPDRLTISGGDNSGTLKIGSNTAIPAHVNLGAGSPSSAAGFRIGRLPGGTFIDLQLSAAESRGDVKIISKPSVTTLNNKAAKIRSGTTIYVKSTSNISVGTTGGSAGSSQSALQTIETGVQLDVTPQITPDNYIMLTINAEESEADFSKTVDGIPAILDNKASTTVILKDGETAVIGGLIKRKDSSQRKSVPGFSKIPVVGLFFKNKTKSNTHNELMVFITPRITKN